jgi:hypothetical protein
MIHSTSGAGNEAPLPVRTRHDVQVVHLEAVGGAAGMVAARHQHNIAVLDRHRLVERSVVGVDPLDTEAFARFQAVVVGLFQIGDAREVVLVVPVARVGGPVARRGEDLGHEDAIAPVLVLHGDVVDVAGVGAPAALGQGDPLRADPARLVVAPAGRGTDGERAVGLGHGRPLGTVRQIEAVRRGLFEHVHPLAKHAPILPRARETGLALYHDEDDLAIAGDLGRRFAPTQSVEREADVAPARQGGGDLVHLAVVAEGLAEKLRHSVVLPMGS